jgi:chromosome segregation ATPase
MAAVTGNDLKRLEDLIINGQKASETRLSAIAASQEEMKTDLKILEKRLNALEVGQAEIKGDIKALEGKLAGDIKTLDTKLDGIGKRLENQEFIVGVF